MTKQVIKTASEQSLSEVVSSSLDSPTQVPAKSSKLQRQRTSSYQRSPSSYFSEEGNTIIEIEELRSSFNEKEEAFENNFFKNNSNSINSLFGLIDTDTSDLVSTEEKSAYKYSENDLLGQKDIRPKLGKFEINGLSIFAHPALDLPDEEEKIGFTL